MEALKWRSLILIFLVLKAKVHGRSLVKHAFSGLRIILGRVKMGTVDVELDHSLLVEPANKGVIEILTL